MAEIVPFRAVRYAATRGRALGELLAPPYDLVSLEQRDELLRRSPHNIIHLTLGEDRPGDGPATTNKYVRAGEYWASWLAQGVLKRDPAPALYPLEQSFWAPDGRNLRRRGFMAAVRLHEFSEGVIVPHEKTLVAPKADRLELLKAVKANLSPIFGLYRDEGDTAQALDAACTAEPAAEATSEDGVHHRLWRCEDAAAIRALQEQLDQLNRPSRLDRVREDRRHWRGPTHGSVKNTAARSRLSGRCPGGDGSPAAAGGAPSSTTQNPNSSARRTKYSMFSSFASPPRLVRS